jgi:hypothetical protein
MASGRLFCNTLQHYDRRQCCSGSRLACLPWPPASLYRGGTKTGLVRWGTTTFKSRDAHSGHKDIGVGV